ncbi:hypothetical protein J3A83DRAFT_4373262 [Scleroderma citrinum]
MIHTAESECVPNLTSPGLGSPTSSPGSLNIKTVFSDFISLEHPPAKGLDSPPSSPLLPSSSSFSLPSLPSSDSFADKLIEKAHTLNAGIDDDDLTADSLESGAKKTAMENLLRAQRSLKEIEVSIAKHLLKETIEGAHAQFLSPLNSSEPEALYLLTVGQIVISPLSSCLAASHTRFIKEFCLTPCIGSQG